MRTLLVLVFSAFLAFPAMAAFQGPGSNQGGGFSGPGSSSPAATVAQVQQMPDDSIVTLTGHIIEKITGTKDKYTFKDETGTIRVEIDHKYFRGQDVTPNDRVRITGEVDKDFGRPTEIDVKMLEVLK